MSILHCGEATAIGGRTGLVASSDGALRLKLAPADKAAGADGTGATPEQLLAAGYAACFLEALRDLAVEDGVTLPVDANVSVKVALADDGGERPGLSAVISVDLPNLDPAAAKALSARAHAACPLSDAARNGFPVHIYVP